MEPLVSQGDLVLFRVAEQSREDGLYVIVQDDRLRVRRLQFFPGGRVRVVSDNKAYDAFDMDPGAPEGTVKIVGPALWILKKT